MRKVRPALVTADSFFTPNGSTGLGDTIVLSVTIFEITPKLRVGGGPS
jgi:hypothetical protein